MVWNKVKICIVSSGGGHLYQLWEIQKAWKNYDEFWVSFKKKDVQSLLKNKKVFFAHYPDSRNIVNFFRNLKLAFQIIKKEDPNIVISAGAGIAPPFLLIAKIMGIKTLYVEPIDFIKTPSLTGKIVSYFVDVFLVQNKKQLKFFPKAKYWGSTL